MDGTETDAVAPRHLQLEDSEVMKSPPSCLKSGNVKVYLKKWSIWDKFYNLGTEMRMSKRGRFMFPYCEYSISGLDPEKNYIMAMDISPVDNYRYRYNGCKWQINGKATPHVMGRLYFHPNGSVSGKEWMVRPLSFAKLRLTNCPTAAEGSAILHSMHRYIPQLHIIVADGIIEKLNLNDPRVYTFVFQQTEFFAVTKYENKFIRQLKHFYNPYGTAFRDMKISKQDVANSRRPRRRCEKKPFFDVVEIHGTTNDQESEQKLKAIIPLKDGAGKIQESTNNEEPLKQMRTIMRAENDLQIKQLFSFEDPQDQTGEIEKLEEKLREELRWNGSHEILHPVLQQSGVKLSDLHPTEWLNLKHLGPALTHEHSVPSSEQNVESSYSSITGSETHTIRETGIPFISRTGKTNDLTKIKGWKNKFNLQPGSPDDKPNPLPTSATTTVLKNRSAFVSDLLDEYLEKEGKIIEQQSLLYDYDMPEIGCGTPNLFDSPCNIQQNTSIHSPDFVVPPKIKSSPLDMSPVLEKHFSVTNKGIFIRDIQSNSMNRKARRRKQNSNSATKRSKLSTKYKNASRLSNKSSQTGFHATSQQKKKLKTSSTNLKVVRVASGSKGGKKSGGSGSHNEAVYISDYKNGEELEERCKQLPATTNRSSDSKTIEIISYCSWNESRVKIIKLIAECAMANRLPCTQRLDKYEIHLEKREGTSLFSPKKCVDLRATIQNFSDSEGVFDKPMMQTMVIEAVVGNSAFKAKLSHLISKASKNGSNPPPVKQISSPVHVVMDLEKIVSSPEKSQSGTTTDRLTTEDPAQSPPMLIAQQKEQDVFMSTTDTTVKSVTNAPSSIKSAVTTFRKIGALSTLVTSTTPIPTSSCFVNPIASQNKTETSSAPTRYLLCKTKYSGLPLGPTDSLDQDGRRYCVTVPSTLKLPPGDSLILHPVKSLDGRQLYKHSSGKVFQLVYRKTAGQIPVKKLDSPQSPVQETPPSAAALESDGVTPHCTTAATSSESDTKHSPSEMNARTGFCTSESLHDAVACDPITPPLQSSSTTWKLVDEVSPPQSRHFFPETTPTEVRRLNRPYAIIPSADCQSKPNSDESSNDILDIKTEMGPVKSPEPEEYNEITGNVGAFPMKGRGFAVTEAYETQWVPANRFEEYHKRTDLTQFDVHNPREAFVEREVSEINTCELVDSDSSEVCTMRVKEEPLNDEENDSFTALRDDAFRSSKLWNQSFNLNTEAVTEAELGVQTHSNTRGRIGFGNSLTDHMPDVPHRGFFQSPQSITHSTRRKAFQPSELCEARKKAILHNLRERESRKMMENRFKILKNNLFDDRQMASKGAILDEAIDVITNLDKQFKNLTMEKELLLGKQKILLEKLSLLSEMEPTITQGGVEDGEIIESGDTLNFSRERDPSQNSFGMKWYSERSPLEGVPDHRAETGVTMNYESNSANSDDIVAVKVGDYLSEKYNNQLDYPDGTGTFPVKEENINDDECPAFDSSKEHCFGSSRFCSFSDFSTDMDALNKLNVDTQGCGEPKFHWTARGNGTRHTLEEKESRTLMEDRFKLLESTVFNDKKAPKGAILLKAINVISDLDIQSDQLSMEKELLMKKQSKLLAEISHLSSLRSEVLQEQTDDGHFSAKGTSDVQALTFQKPSDTQWLKNSDPSEAVVINDSMSERQSDKGIQWEQDEVKVSSLNTVKMEGNTKESHQEVMSTDCYDLSSIRQKACNGQDEDAFFSVGKASPIGSSDFGSHSDFDLNMDEVNEIDVEILTHSESENVDFEMEDDEVNYDLSVCEKLCAPPRWHFHNYSQSHKVPRKKRIIKTRNSADAGHPLQHTQNAGGARQFILKSGIVSDLRKTRKNPLLHTLREREWRKQMQKRFNELRELLFQDERVSKRAILIESINEIHNLCQQSRKLCMEKKLLMKKHKALLKIISVLSAEKKVKNQKGSEKNPQDCEYNGATVSTGQPLSSAAKESSEESALVPIAGTPFHLLREKIAVPPHGEELGRISPVEQPEGRGTKQLTSESALVCHQEETHLTFSEDYTHKSSAQSREEVVIQRQVFRSGQVSDVVPRAVDVASKNRKTANDEERVNSLSQKFKATTELVPLNESQLEKQTQGPLFWSMSPSHGSTAVPLTKDQSDPRLAGKGKLQVIRSTKGQDILQKLAKKVQEAAIKPWVWKSKREDSENVPQTLFESGSKLIQCFQKASTVSDSESPIAPFEYTDTTKVFGEGKSLHRLLPDQILKQGPAQNRGEQEQMESELDMDSASSMDSTTAAHAVREPKIFISSIDIHSANEANANGGYLVLDSTQ
ncbi:uncharacterized protein [Mobula birostris]|uniref:uncharacterized protein isoform X2 n=1 Tax=Mobula birostris TaxID=1983395 RepID=UPI003B282A23